jgi:protein-S-isoprenylcysteine O-methyltransferase Ste14
MLLARVLIAMVILPGTAGVLIPWLIVDGSDLSPFAWLAVPPIAFGIALSAWCVVEFATRGRGTPAPWDAPRHFVASGPYRAVRNPMYLAAAAVVLGEAIAFGSLALIAYLIALITVWHLFVVMYEEPTLARRFGTQYEEYRRAVPGWWPRRRPWQG